ncbi:MAG TPA: TIGR03915 family putative DNA repair protein [Chitinophagaceae bacterium]|nr:TIGR03915 family putative DNA repair protein [Chitinophagaceae bacterium]
MDTLLYDGSFDGLLTAIFEVYEYKFADAAISKQGAAGGSLFGKVHVVQTDITKATRVHKKIAQHCTQVTATKFYKTFLSELPGIENQLLSYVQYVLSQRNGGENNFSHPAVLTVHQVSRKVDREKHRMEAFVRFQLTGDDLYYSIIQPDYNVLPLIGKHFKERYADQRWLIYDARRSYGIYYDMQEISAVEINFDTDMRDKNLLATIHNEKEALYQQLWRQYFSSVNIAARKNMKLHIQHMPKRYWRNLVEKLPGDDLITGKKKNL